MANKTNRLGGKISRSHIAAIENGEMLFQEIDTSEEPLFQVVDLVRAFFAKSTHWIHWLERTDKIVWEGEKLEPRREKRGKGEARVYSISDIEKLVYALSQREVISERERVAALVTLLGIAYVWEYA